MNYESKKCKAIVPYICGEQPQDKKYIKLNTNENPYNPSDAVGKVILGTETDKLKLYPDPENTALREAIAQKYNLNKNQIFVGNGSDEVLAFIFPAFFDEDGLGVAFADITYSFYPVYSDFYNIKKVIIPVNKDYEIDFADYDKIDVQGYIICNPNAPTGIAVKKEIIIDFIKKHKDKIIVLDEAYADFCNESVADYINTYDNLLVVKTFSKSYSLAGIRCGYALGNTELIKALNKIKNSFNSYTVNRMTESIAVAAINDKGYYDSINKKVMATRDRISIELNRLGFTVLPSSSNFIFIKSDKISGERLYIALKDRGILVRHFKKKRIEDFIRVSIGTDSEMQSFLEAIKEISK